MTKPFKKYPNKPHVNRGISFEQLMGLMRPPEKVPLYQYTGSKGEIEVMSRGMTIVLSRDVRANVKIAADIAVTVAKRNPERPVWYVNTFAGIEMMQEAMDEARRNVGLPEVVPNMVIGEPEDDQSSGEGSKDAALHASLVVLPDSAQQHEGSGAEDGTLHAVLPNLHFFEIPTGQWNVDAFTAALNGEKYIDEDDPYGDNYDDDYSLDDDEEDENEEKVEVEKPKPIIIINSFEYAPFNGVGRWKMARQLLDVLEVFDASILLFTQEMRQEFMAGIGGRGSIGLLCGKADRVNRMVDPFEHLIRSRKPRNQPEHATVHEAQMLTTNDLAQAPRRIITVKNEGETGGFEIADSDKWELARKVGEILLD